MRVALFGGTFDPPHRGHVAIARAAAETFRLDRVLWTPAGKQPLKPEPAAASYTDRLTMAGLACGGDARFAVSDLDAPRPDGEANYTARTLESLGAAMPGAELFCLVGADSFAGLARWREPSRLLGMAEWIVVSRPGFGGDEPEGMTLSAVQRGRVHRLDTVWEDVSATALRGALAAGQDCREWVPEAVADFIARRHLYGAGAGTEVAREGLKPVR